MAFLKLGIKLLRIMAKQINKRANKNWRFRMFSLSKSPEKIEAKSGSADLSTARVDILLYLMRVFQIRFAAMEAAQI